MMLRTFSAHGCPHTIKGLAESCRLLRFWPMKAAICSFLLFLLMGCYRDGGAVIIAAHDISAQTVIQDPDLEAVTASKIYKQGANIPAHTIRDRRDAIGHKALHPIPKSAPLNSRDIE